MLAIKQLNYNDQDFWLQLKHYQAVETEADQSIHQAVSAILADVAKHGDQAVLEYTQRWDNLKVDGLDDLTLTTDDLAQIWQGLATEQQQALEQASQRIYSYHRKQLQQSWEYTEANGTVLGQQITALDSVGLYVPGGKAAYPSSVLMNAIPAKVAGVKQMIMTVPTPNAERNVMVLAAAYLAGVDKVYCVGGAQAVAAMAYGTESIQKVDKIVGPGNIYVATAKKMVYGLVGIDMIAGPSEILVISDGCANPDWLAMDLFSQAEHDEDAQSVLITDDPAHLEAVLASMEKLLPTMERAGIIQTSLNQRGMAILVNNMDEAVAVTNTIAPEHLELAVEQPEPLKAKIRHAGAIFMGAYTAEVFGDYCAGPNHVLPTAGTARFSSPLGVYDFQKRSSIIHCSAEGANELARIATALAYSEGLTAHARSAEYRKNS